MRRKWFYNKCDAIEIHWNDVDIRSKFNSSWTFPQVATFIEHSILFSRTIYFHSVYRFGWAIYLEKLNPIWMVTDNSWHQPFTADKNHRESEKKNRIECKQNTRNNMLDASISLIPMPLKCNTTEPPLRETHSSTIIRKSEPFRWNREILSQEYIQ